MIKSNKDQLEISEHFMANLHSWLKGYYRYFGFPTEIKSLHLCSLKMNQSCVTWNLMLMRSQLDGEMNSISSCCFSKYLPTEFKEVNVIEHGTDRQIYLTVDISVSNEISRRCRNVSFVECTM